MAGTQNRWKGWWDGPLTQYVAGVYSATSYFNDDFHLKQLAHLLYGVIMVNGDVLETAMQHAIHLANNRATQAQLDNSNTAMDPQERRAAAVGLALTWDMLTTYSGFTAANKAKIGDALIRVLDKMNNDFDDLMDGHAPADQAAKIVGAISLFGESGSGFNYDTGASSAKTRLDFGLDYQYGGNAAVTSGGEAALDTHRYFSTVGGSGKGIWYEEVALHSVFQQFLAMTQGFSAITLDDAAYVPFDEAWVEQVMSWLLHFGLRGDGEIFRIGDTNRNKAPWFVRNNRGCASTLVTYPASGTYRKQAMWFLEQWHRNAGVQNAKDAGDTSGSAYQRAHEFVLVDPSDPLNAAKHPADISTAKLKYWSTPGAYSYVSDWSKDAGMHLSAQFPEFWYYGHQDLDVGAIQITVKNDMVLLNRGLYDTSVASDNAGAADNGGTMTNNFSRQSISKSGIVRVSDELAVSGNTPHRARDRGGTKRTYPNGEGGQLWKHDGAENIDPRSVGHMRFDGSGNMWRRCEGRPGAPAGTTGMELIGGGGEGDSYAFFYANARRGYLRLHTELGGAVERTRVMECRDMLIRNQPTGPILFRYWRADSRLASMKKAQGWNFWGNPVVGNFPATGKFYAEGYLGTVSPSPPTREVGVCMVWYYNHTAFSAFQTGGNQTKDALGYGNQQFFYNPYDGSGGKNYPPSEDIGNYPRHLPDLGLYRIDIKPKVQAVRDDFVCLVIPLVKGDSEDVLGVKWLTEDKFYGVQFGNGDVYKINKTDFTFVAPNQPVDNIPPGAPTGLAATVGAVTGRVSLSWTANSIETDLRSYRVYRRIKV